MKEYNLPDINGKFGNFGGKFVPETLITPLKDLERVYMESKDDPEFRSALYKLNKEYTGRPTPLTFADRLTKYYGKGKIYLKREDCCHTGSHKINNALGQVLLALKLGKKRIIAETGAGQHGVATATVAAKFGLECDVFMGEVDMERQQPNVFRMQLLGTRVVPVSSGSKTLKDATNEAMRDWAATVDNTHYVIGSVMGPHPYPMMVRDFQSVIGNETKEQILQAEGRLPDHIIACVGGGSNSMGIFYPFLKDDVNLIGVEAGGLGLDTDKHCATLAKGKEGIFQGMKTYVLQDDFGQILEVYSVSAGLDYPGVGPEHSNLKDMKRVQYVSATDAEALKAVSLLSKYEGIIPALESSHAVTQLEKLMPNTTKDDIVVVNVSGRGDKDMSSIMKNLEQEKNNG